MDRRVQRPTVRLTLELRLTQRLRARPRPMTREDRATSRRHNRPPPRTELVPAHPWRLTRCANNKPALCHWYPVYTIKLVRRAGYMLAGRASSMFARRLLDRVNGVCPCIRSLYRSFCRKKSACRIFVCINWHGGYFCLRGRSHHVHLTRDQTQGRLMTSSSKRPRPRLWVK